jgi:uroporphyrin-III C-methyltransferase
MMTETQEVKGNKAMVNVVLPSHIMSRIPQLQPGQVALVGAGPGDPGLLTLNAIMLIQQADVLVCDRLVSDEIAALKPAKAELINAGKSCKEHVLTQDQTNQVLVDQAKLGKRVVRLKGGDPYIFGRGGEEVEVLMDNQIESIIVPGITAAAGCSAYAGFPLTHRDFAQSVTLATGHIKHDGKLELDWSALASDDRTVVFYMGLNNAQLISDNLQAQGRDGDTPVGLIERGTTLQQRTVFTTLAELPQAIKDNGLKPPTMMIVGEVVSIALKNEKKNTKNKLIIAAQNAEQSNEQDTLAQA